MSRFEVGKDYFFIEVDYTAADPMLSSLYAPWQDTLNELRVIKVTCTEHHKVPGEWGPADEKEHDGFIFKDEAGNIWRNQYPYASYGQLDDSNDWKIRRHYEDAEYDEMSDKKLDIQLAGAKEACKFIQNILRACNPESSFGYMGDDCVTEIEALKKFQEEVVAEVEKVSGRSVDIAPWIVKKGTREEHLVKGVLRVTLVERLEQQPIPA